MVSVFVSSRRTLQRCGIGQRTAHGDASGASGGEADDIGGKWSVVVRRVKVDGWEQAIRSTHLYVSPGCGCEVRQTDRCKEPDDGRRETGRRCSSGDAAER
jgi:hypothetical protein